MYKDKEKTPPFFLSLKIFGKNIHNYLINLADSCNGMQILISQRLGVTPKPTNLIVIQIDKMEVKVIIVLNDVCIQLTIDPII